MLTIRHLTGPLAGTENRFDPKTDRIMFGRQLDCDVVYPAEETIVARRHFALVRKASGHWTFDLFGQPFVAVNGESASPGDSLPPDAKIELGKHGGPSFQVVMAADQRTDNLPLTMEQEQDPSPRRLAALASRGAGRATRIAAGAIALGLVAVAGAGYYSYRSSQDAARLQEALAKMAGDQSRDASLRISEAVRGRLARGVYLVALRDNEGRLTAGGTAWPVGPRLLGTNAHVAELRDDLKPGESLVIRTPGENGRTLNVVGHAIHPGFKAFAGYVASDPIFLQGFRGKAEQVDLLPLAYDVATLQVDADLPADEIFELGGDNDLNALGSGSAVATAGYPLEGIVGAATQTVRAAPELHIGTITGVTDFFSMPASAGQSRLVHHDLPSVGGQSGSPIVGPHGRVVALLNAGNITQQGTGKRAPSAALINYAQRADMLRELIANEAAGRLEADRSYWAQRMANFKRGMDVIVPEILDKMRPAPNGTPELVSEETHTLGVDARSKKQDGGTQRQKGHPLSIPAGTPHLVLAYAQGTTPIEMYIVNGQQIVGRATDLKWFPAIAIGAQPSPVQGTVWIVNPQDADVTYTFRIYRYRQAGAAG